uniref:Uncharacterized protein n=1 Tax=Pseudomonas phage Cygsa01 TaxID=3138529 RepID=A0AAU6W3K6_9VIRU
MGQFNDFLRNYRHRIDEDGESPTNVTGASIAMNPGGGLTFTRKMVGVHPHYTVEDHVYRDIRKGKKKYSRWDKYIPHDSELCTAMKACMGKYGQVTVESKLGGQSVRLRK